MILCISPNLCHDRIVTVPGFAAGQIHRAEPAVLLASGKGLNVARAARSLGELLTVVGFVGGPTGEAIVQGARRGGLLLDAIRVPGESRVCTIIVDPGRGETVINERGVTVDARAVRGLCRRVRHHLDAAAVVVMTGSLPPGAPDDLFGALVTEAAARPTVLDSSGEALRQGLAARPTVAKPNLRELEDVVGRALASPHDIAAAAQGLRTGGMGWIVVSLGEAGAVLVTGDGTWHLRPPRVERVSAVGAGDTLVAGLAVGLARGLAPLDAARLGVAASAADVATVLPGMIEVETVRAFVPEVGVEPL